PPGSPRFPSTTLFRSGPGREVLLLPLQLLESLPLRFEHLARVDVLVHIRLGAELLGLDALRLLFRGRRLPALALDVWRVVVDQRSEEHTSELQSRENL